MTLNKIDVLDHGFVRLVDWMGSDLSVVNAARVSYDKEAKWESYLRDDPITQPEGSGMVKTYTYKSIAFRLKTADKRLLKYLAEHNHTSPFRHAVLSFEIYAPLMVMRQLGKYRVGSSFTFEDSDDSLETWNESSRRYITEEPVFYIPEVWRSAPENKKQGSGEPVDPDKSSDVSEHLAMHTSYSLGIYQGLMSYGVCAEQARLFLPAYAMYIRARWTVSLQGVIHFLQQRLGEDAQFEIAEYARAVLDLAKPKFPESFQVWGL